MPSADVITTDKVKGALAVLAALIALSMAAMLAIVAAIDNRAVTIATERERVQLLNALNLKLANLRGGLTSVTFWDEAVAHTAVALDEPWIDENIGHWLARFYGADMSFVLDPMGAAAYASQKGQRIPSARFDAIAPVVAPLRQQVLAKLRSYKSANPDAAYDVVDETYARGLDAARLAVVDGRPLFVIVAPILPDFGRVAVSPSRYHLLVAVYDIDDSFLAQLAQAVLIDRLALIPSPPNADAGELAAADNARQNILLRWRPQHAFGDLFASVLPLALLVLLAFLSASLLVLFFVRRSTQELLVTRYDAMHDELTGLPNRRLFTQRLDEALAQRVASEPLAVMFIDLDRFKEVNDIWGHPAGDIVIRSSVQRISEIIGADTVARFGGDEFVVMLRHPEAVIRGIAAKILDCLHEPHDIGGTRLMLTGSIGIAFATGRDVTAGEMLRRADLALYRAKELGKDRYAMFEPSLDRKLQARRRLEKDLRVALLTGEIDVAYQPQIRASDRSMVGVEALARWCHPDHGDVSPSMFVSIAEDAGIIRALGNHVLEQAMRDASAWPDLQLAVNVSPMQLRDDNFIDEVARLLAITEFAPDRLTIEITEGVLVINPETARSMIDRLRALGVRVALDDFGTGYSSLAYLRSFKFDELKIDRSFISGLKARSATYTLLASIVALGRALNLLVTAEGIETAEQLELLAAVGCDQLQGNMIGLPVTREVITQMRSSMLKASSVH